MFSKHNSCREAEILCLFNYSKQDYYFPIH